MRICTPKQTRCYISGSTPPTHTHTPTRHYANSHPPTRNYAIPPPRNRALCEFPPPPHKPDIMQIHPTNQTLCEYPTNQTLLESDHSPPPPHSPPTKYYGNLPLKQTRRYVDVPPPPPTPSLSILSDPPPTRNYGNLIHPFYQRDVMWICLKGEGTKSMTGKPRWEGITNPMFTFAASARKQKACGCKERI